MPDNLYNIWGHSRNVVNTRLWLVFSTFPSCSQMPVVIFNSVRHNLSFFYLLKKHHKKEKETLFYVNWCFKQKFKIIDLSFRFSSFWFFFCYALLILLVYRRLNDGDVLYANLFLSLALFRQRLTDYWWFLCKDSQGSN